MKRIIAVMLAMLLLAGCSSAASGTEQDAGSTPQAVSAASEPAPTAQPTATPPAPDSTAPESEAEEPAQDEQPDKEGSEPVAEPETAPAPIEASTEPQPAAELSYGAVPFELAANSDKWWAIDSTDTAYWAVQENINAIRASVGLGALSMDESLSAIASSRCESFVAGGPFDHSGMVTKSEICASGPLFSASAVCTAWQNSDAHYAAMTRSDITRMGVGCWFCVVDGNKFTYWTVTFE